MRFDDILPHLIDAYRRGILVPFIGSGMSRPACTGWQPFVERLAGEAGLKVPEPPDGPQGEFPPEELYRLADKAVHRLRHKDVEERAKAYRRALLNASDPSGFCDLPSQTKALAKLAWPLVLTTNYDDLYLQSWSEERGYSPEVLGRSIADCHRVIRSLDAPTTPPLLWALQGFLGGQAAQPDRFIKRERHLAFMEQLVVGYQQYQNVTNAQPHFRRAFAEVFHRRSFLFMGSGLLENYLLNLFGEIFHHFGPSPRPHFALVLEKEERKLDPQFLTTRLGIVPIFYSDHDELPVLLGELAERIRGTSPPEGSTAGKPPVAWMMDELGFALADGTLAPSGTVRRVKLRHLRYSTNLPLPAEGSSECTIANLGRDDRNRPMEGRGAGNLLKKARESGLKEQSWKACDEEPSYVYRFGTSTIFGVCARSRNASPGESHEWGDLGTIPEAVCAALRTVDTAGFRSVNLGPVASGPKSLWRPLHPFVQTLAGVRRFFASTPGTGIENLTLHVFEPTVWSELVSGKVPVSEFLSSEVTKIWVEIRDAEEVPEFHCVTVHGSTTVGQLKDLCGLEREDWSTEILPPSTKSVESDRADALEVAPTSIVIFSPR